MTSPQTHATQRALRARLPGAPQAMIRFEDGQHSSARLQTVSITGGLLQVLKPLNPGAMVEVMFWTQAGPVLGIAELLGPYSSVRIGLQPFRFTAMDESDIRTLHIAIASSELCTAGFRTDVAEEPRQA